MSQSDGFQGWFNIFEIQFDGDSKQYTLNITDKETGKRNNFENICIVRLTNQARKKETTNRFFYIHIFVSLYLYLGWCGG